MSFRERISNANSHINEWVDRRYGMENRYLARFNAVLGTATLGMVGAYVAHRTGVHTNGEPLETLIEIGGGAGLAPTAYIAYLLHRNTHETTFDDEYVLAA